MQKTILVADDAQRIREVVAFMLRGRGHAVLQAADGDAAYRLAVEAAPDLIVLDVMMPGKSGIDICAELKADPARRGTPVVLLTAIAQDTGLSDEEMRRRTGADAFFSKPFSAKELYTCILKLLSTNACVPS